MTSSEPQQWDTAINKEILNLQEDKLCDLVSISNIPKDKMVIGLRVVFK